MKTLIALLFLSQVSFAAGKLQNEDFKTKAQIEAAGGSASQLLNDTKIWVTSNGINKQLSVAISDGDIGGNLALDVVGSLPNANAATISGDSLRLQPADGLNPGVMTAVSQSIGGDKKFDGQMMVGSLTAAHISDAAFQVSGTNRGSRPLPKVAAASISAMESGVMTYDTATNQPAFYDGTQWVGMSGVSQATFYGALQGVGGTGCNFQESSSTGPTDFVDLGAGSGCGGWTAIGNVAAQGTNDHRLVTNNIPPGQYAFEVTGNFDASGTAGQCNIRLTDGTITSEPQDFRFDTTASQRIIRFIADVPVAGNRTWKIQASDNHGNACRWNPGDSSYRMAWKVWRYPTYSETAIRLNQNPNYYSGYHDNTCSWSRTNTAYGAFTADASCALTTRNSSDITATTSGSVLPSLAVTFPRLGTYFVCSKISVFGSVSTGHGIRLTDGTNVLSEGSDTSNGETDEKTLCGVYTTTSLTPTFTLEGKAAAGSIVVQSQASGPAVEWTIFPISPNLQMPVIVGSVSSNSSGAERMERAELNCDASSSISSQSGSWLSAIGNRSGAGCTITIASGIFASTPSCTFTAKATAVQATSVNMTSATAGTVYGASADYDGYLFCMGSR